jgi:hypothetical protein
MFLIKRGGEETVKCFLLIISQDFFKIYFGSRWIKLEHEKFAIVAV